MTILVLPNSNNTMLSSRDVLTSASLPILLSSLTQQPHTPPPDLYGGSRPARGGAGKPNTPLRGSQHQFPGSQSRGWLNSYSLPGVNLINNSAITVLLKDTARIANDLVVYAKGMSRPLFSDTGSTLTLFNWRITGSNKPANVHNSRGAKAPTDVKFGTRWQSQHLMTRCAL